MYYCVFKPVALWTGTHTGFAKHISFKLKCFCSIPVRITATVVVKPLFQRDWRWLGSSKQCSKTLEFRNPTTKSCGCTLNTREHKNGNFDVNCCVCCMQRLPHLGQPIKLERRTCFQKREPVWNFVNGKVFVVIINPPYPHQPSCVCPLTFDDISRIEKANYKPYVSKTFSCHIAACGL